MSRIKQGNYGNACLASLIVITFIFVVFQPNLVAAEEEVSSPTTIDAILARQTIRVGTTGDYMPFSYRDMKHPGNFQGIDIEMAVDLARSLDVEVKFVQTSWTNLMTDLAADKFDIAMSGISITLDRQRVAMFSEPLLSDGKAAISRDEDAARFRSLEAINRPAVRVIFNPGGTNEKFARENFSKATLILNEDNITIFQKIVDGHADVMVTDAIETLIQEKIHPQLEAVNPEQPFSFSQKAFLFKRDPILKAYIDQWLNLRLNDGTYKDIYDQQLKITTQ